MRTLAHELSHHKQDLEKRLKVDSGKTGSDIENEANAKAGEIMRKYDDSHPKEFKKKTTVGIRIPDNNIVLEIVRQLGNPIVSTSIHDEDEIIEYSTDPELIFEKWQNLVDAVIDGGYGDNVPSTIIDLSEGEPVVVREGKGDIDII